MPESDAPGLPARRLAAIVIDEVLRARVALDETLDRLVPESGLDAADAGLTRAIAVTAFRRLGTIRQALDERLDRGSPRHSGLFEPILTAAAAQILFLDVPDHAAVDLAIRHLHEDPRSARYTALGNALLRRVVRERDAILAEADADPFRDTPDWLAESWRAAYGEEAATAIALNHREEPPLDITAKADPALWADKLGGILLPTGSIRLRERQAIATLPGFEDGAWWVQDAAAALPVKLISPAPGERIADLCAAPGGKTAQIAAAGASVTALDRSAPRLRRLKANLQSAATDQELAVTKAVSSLEKDLNEAKSKLGVQAAEQKAKDVAVAQSHAVELAVKDELIERYKDLKAKLSVKVKGPAAVRSGAKGAFKVTVSNNGTGIAKGVKITATGGGKGTAGNINPGAKKTVTVKTKVTGRKGSKKTLTFTAKGGATAKGKARVTVR